MVKVSCGGALDKLEFKFSGVKYDLDAQRLKWLEFEMPKFFEQSDSKGCDVSMMIIIDSCLCEL